MIETRRILNISLVAVLSSCMLILNGCSNNVPDTQQTFNNKKTNHPSHNSDTSLLKTDVKQGEKNQLEPIDHFKQSEVVKVLTSNGIKFEQYSAGGLDSFYSSFRYWGGPSNNEWDVFVTNDNGSISNDLAKRIWSEIWSLHDKKTEALQVRICWTNNIDKNQYSISVSNIGGNFHGKNYFTGETFE